jgi:hypothetical protein
VIVIDLVPCLCFDQRSVRPPKPANPAAIHLAIDSKLRGFNLVGMKVQDVTLNGYALAQATYGREN